MLVLVILGAVQNAACDSRSEGVDLNRNFNYLWGLTGALTSSWYCDDTYNGPSVFSEIETRNVRDFILDHKNRIVLFQTFHSYYQAILTPGNTTHPARQEVTDLANLALQSVNGEEYQVGCVECVLGNSGKGVTGTSMDWAYWTVGIPYSYTTELPPKVGDSAGFELPKEKILPTAADMWAWHTKAANQMIEEFRKYYPI